MELMEKARKGPPLPQTAPPPELAAMILEAKTEHYRAWLDESIPALGGRTPREAAKDPRLRRDLDVLLKEFEYGETQQPAGTRIDFAMIRAELGLS